MTKLTQPLKWHGGKNYLAPKIVALMPRHLHYVEPYAGGLAVLLARDPNDERLWLGSGGSTKGVSEVVNDLNGQLVNFWRVLASLEDFPIFKRAVDAMPMARDLFGASKGPKLAEWLHQEGYPAKVSLAVAFFVCARQSRAGTFKGFTALSRNRTRRGVNGNVSEWLGAVDGLPAIHDRLRAVVIENVPAVKLIHRDDAAGTLFYLDPPYLHETRATKDAYECEMTEAQHRELLATITHENRRGKFMLSGYRSGLYDEFLAGWTRHEFDLPNHAAGGKEKRRMTECLWCNF